MEIEEWLKRARAGEIPEVPVELSRSISGDRVKLVRGMVQPSDLDWIIKNLTKYDDPDRAGFFPTLVANYSHDKSIASSIRNHWAGASTIQRMKLSWRILDFHDLVERWHTEVFEFVVKNWVEFNDEAMMFYGGGLHERMISVLDRYLSEQFSTRKGWMYICNAWYLREEFPAISAHLLDLGRRSEVPFVRLVSRDLENRALEAYRE
jgi:hypothetical protein